MPLQGMLVGSCLCVFSWSTHIKMLTCIINLQVRVCVSVSVCDRISSGCGGGTADCCRSEPLKTVVLRWVKYTGETC